MSNYEIDFIGNTTKGDSDAICFRWKGLDDKFHIGIYDCGTKAQADKMIKHIEEYYFKDMNKNDQKIECLVCSHADADHVRGIKTLLESFTVDTIYVNIPWKYAEELVDMSSNCNSESWLTSKLKKDYTDLAEMINYAKENKIKIRDAFQNTAINDDMLIIAPKKKEYIENIAKSPKNNVKKIVEGSSQMSEGYDGGLLNNPETSEENETSVVLLGMINNEDNRFLLVGDSGVDNLKTAMDYADCKSLAIEETVNFYQIPHHGGQHNLDDETVDRMLGNIGEYRGERVAFISVGKDSDHPRKNVVEAYKKRGVKVYKTEGNVIHHRSGYMPNRDGWVSLKEL